MYSINIYNTTITDYYSLIDSQSYLALDRSHLERSSYGSPIAAVSMNWWWAVVASQPDIQPLYLAVIA